MKIIKIIFSIILIMIIIIFAKSVIYPSSISYKLSCSVDGPRILEDAEFEIAGVTKLNRETGEVTVDIIKEDPYVIKHEQCHVKQIERNFPSVLCEDPIQKFISEIECYTTQYLPNGIHKIFYST